MSISPFAVVNAMSMDTSSETVLLTCSLKPLPMKPSKTRKASPKFLIAVGMPRKSRQSLIVPQNRIPRTDSLRLLPRIRRTYLALIPWRILLCLHLPSIPQPPCSPLIQFLLAPHLNKRRIIQKWFQILAPYPQTRGNLF